MSTATALALAPRRTPPRRRTHPSTPHPSTLARIARIHQSIRLVDRFKKKDIFDDTCRVGKSARRSIDWDD